MLSQCIVYSVCCLITFLELAKYIVSNILCHLCSELSWHWIANSYSGRNWTYVLWNQQNSWLLVFTVCSLAGLCISFKLRYLEGQQRWRLLQQKVPVILLADQCSVKICTNFIRTFICNCQLHINLSCMREYRP